MKLYPLHIGNTKVPYGQFYGGKEWTGWRGFWRFVTDKSHSIMVPIYAYLIEHQEAGLILVDAGINWEQANEHNQYYKGPLLHLLLDEDEYQLDRALELRAQVQRLGYRCEEIQMVILTHIHEDHIGGLPAVPQAKLVVSQVEWNAKLLGPFFPLAKAPTLVGRKPELVAFSSGPYQSFERSQDLLGDESILLLPTPGHSPGHLSVLIRMEGYAVLIVGDTLYTLRHLAVDQVRAIMLSKSAQHQQLASIRQIQRLRQAEPDLLIAPMHDHTAYLSRYLEPGLSAGDLSLKARQAIKAYEARMFEQGYHLVPDALPHFLPPADEGRVGTVTEPALV
ncbi:N-acyl homoserine lactonase family protein [Ktedonosporobacter rubrisoli]|uniref:N-acyl homoserine lactonase family protein n=1 Tax=Ktedonosporobacter rubrisoli TaxID=2509675 RepID=A0A4P6JPX8_KTERU|nr:N-acyl homoserine lactonase family protein [Ktedonosporobacter rubrisoli]QBD77355.1 N-acyl homoserine lactonase family protein [Ktedonosporobacter rubrisoli]